ncbi:MAG: cytochrome c family protein [Acetobacteraceae bacterium]|nr:cytochrome c family protein [Acetobacteraceae bacterium]
MTAMLAGQAVADDHGDADAGKRIFAQCRACHVTDRGARSPVGPNLYGVFGRTAGTLEGFRFSEPMKKKGAEGLVWNNQTIRAYIANPRAVVPGGSMVFAGIRNEKQLNDLIAYLRKETGAQ